MDIAIAKNRLASVVKPDSITASQGDFLATHVAIKKLVMLNKFEFVPTSEKYMSEEYIYKKFIVMFKKIVRDAYEQSGKSSVTA